MIKKLTFVMISMLCAWASTAQTTTLYGTGAPGYTTSGTTAANALFTNPYGIAYDTKGDMWITDQGNHFIVLINSAKYNLREGQPGGGFQDGSSASLHGGLVYVPA